MNFRSLLLVCSCASLLWLHGDAAANKWPQPAAGASASGDPELLLTFDDGPHETHTRKILDILGARHLQAIFFWTGHRVLNPRRGLKQRIAMVKRAVAQGQIVQNHTTTHAKLCTVTKSRAIHEIDDNSKLYQRLSGLPQILFRVPYGVRCKRLDRMLAERGLAHLHWDMDPQEFKTHSSQATFDYVTNKLRKLKPGHRAVLLMHDTHPSSVKALPRILGWIDRENLKRSKRGRRPIHIIGASEYVEEQHPVPLLRWLQRSAVQCRSALLSATTPLLTELP